MSASPDAVANRVRRLSRVSTFGNARANQFIEFGKASAVVRESHGTVENS